MSRSLTFKFMLGITGIVVAVLVLALTWDLQYQQGQVDEDLLAKAGLIAKEQQASRSFTARSQGGLVHGGAARPLSPTEVTQGVSDLFANLSESQIKQTNLTVRNPKNAPDEFERQALERFSAETDLSEVYERVVGPTGQTAFRYLLALRADQSCLVCHGGPKGELDRAGYPKEGLKEGDLAGAISVILPMRDALQRARSETIRMAILVLAVAALTLIMIWFLLQRQVSSPLDRLAAVAASVGGNRIRVDHEELKALSANRETAVVADAFQAMSNRLQELYDGLEQKVAERTAELEKANGELERASHLKSEFLAMVSHEFRTPLTSIMTFTELLLGGAAGKLNPDQQEYLTDVMDSSQRLLQMINDLLDLTRLEAGKIKLFQEVMAVPDVVQDAVKTMTPLAEKKQIDLSLSVASPVPLVMADPLRITQVLFNLLGNAIKFTPEGGRVTVRVREQGAEVEVAVADTGIGISPADQAKIFEAFRQAGAQRPEGSGLGLAVASSLVELHGGRIWVESEPERGSTFFFTLPRCTQEGSDGDDYDPQADSGGR